MCSDVRDKPSYSETSWVRTVEVVVEGIDCIIESKCHSRYGYGRGGHTACAERNDTLGRAGHHSADHGHRSQDPVAENVHCNLHGILASAPEEAGNTESERIRRVQRVAVDVAVGAPGHSRKRIPADELPRRRVVVAGPEVDEARLGVGVLAGPSRDLEANCLGLGQGGAGVVPIDA